MEAALGGIGGLEVIRRFWAVLLVVCLVFSVVSVYGFVFFSSLPSAAGKVFRPSIGSVGGADANGNRISDTLDLEISQRVSNHTSNEPANVVVMLDSEPSVADVNAFRFAGGSVTTDLWSSALYGFGGQIPYGQIVVFARSSANVLLVEKDAVCEANVAYAARQVGARSYVWSTLGLQGDPSSSLAVLDTGIDGSHVDFAPGYGSADFSKKIVGWDNQVTSVTTPFDDNGHGSHCSGLAAGDGFFSVNSAGFASATWGGDFGGLSSGTYYVSGIMVNQTGPITVSVRWSNTLNGGLSDLRLYSGGKSVNPSSWTQVALVSTSSKNNWYTLTYNVNSVPSGGYDMYHFGLTISRAIGSLYIMFNVSWPYAPPADGFSAWTGLAPDSKLVGVKVLDSTGSGTSVGLIGGLNWLIANRVTYHVTVASLSLGFSGEVTSVDVAIANLVNSGISTVVAAGNGGSGSNKIYTPGSVDDVLTVAAMNQFDGVTSYSSQGGTSGYTGATSKPDVTAPGGSFYAVPLFSADTNYNDAEGGWSDVQANDAAPMQGTSMATPIVAGAAQVLVEALGGFSSWNYTRAQALMLKMLLLMTATETYPNSREGGTSATSPTLDRGGPDAQEGYGRLNLDAAADAVLKVYLPGTTVADSLGLPPSTSDISVLGQHLAWARNVELFSGVSYSFSLSVPSGADYDLYLYNTTGTNFGEPVILTKSTTPAAGANESITYTPSLSGEYYVVVKRATETTGGGQFTLMSTSSQSAHILLTVDPNQPTYARGQLLTLNAAVLNQLNPSFNSSLTFTVTGPNGYYLYDSQPVTVGADEVRDYIFSWIVPDVVGTYVVEVGLIPARLTAYDAAWLDVS
jgi:subtilisin family serine protease